MPAVSTAARGSFRAVLSEDESAIEYRLDYSDLQGTVRSRTSTWATTTPTAGSRCGCAGPADHPADHHPPAGTPTCGAPGGDGPEAWGTLTAANVVGPAGQLIAPGEFAELVRAIKSGVTYANVHTTLALGGEIRGQIKVD